MTAGEEGRMEVIGGNGTAALNNMLRYKGTEEERCHRGFGSG